MNKNIISFLFFILPNLVFGIEDPIDYQMINHWESVVLASDAWQYRLGDAQPSSQWIQENFDASSWLTGPGGIGYGDDDDATEIQPTVSLFIRREFNITDVSKIEGALLDADFDDGFVAYLNGVEIARKNLIGQPPRNTENATELREAQMYSGGAPERFEICNAADLLKNGSNVLAVQIHNFDGVSSSDMSAIFFLSLGIKDESRDYRPTPSWFYEPGPFMSHLPILKISSTEPLVDEPKVPGRLEIIWNEDGTLNNSTASGNEFDGDIMVELRGQSSLFFFPKVGYGFETVDLNGNDIDTSFLGFPAEEDWILHGPYSDKTLMRNVLAMHLARKMGQYASRTRYVELMVNGDYRGVYILMEKIKRDKNRVDIANLKNEDIEGEELTGGYVFKIDKGDADWESNYNPVNNQNEKIRYQFVSPNRNNIQPEQATYLQSYIDSFETAVNSPQFNNNIKSYDRFIDFTSFAEHFIHAELSKNVDAYRISSYFHKKKITNGGLIHAGPVWDFNLSFGNSEYCNVADVTGWMYYEHCGNGNPNWWIKMLNDDEFTRILKCRWEELREGPFHKDSIFQFIDEQVAVLGDAVDRNYERWPILNQYVWPNNVVTGSFEEEITYFKTNIRNRLAWMDGNLFGECTPSSTKNIGDINDLILYPNPTDGLVNINFSNSNNYQLSILDLNGKVLLKNKIDAPKTIDLSSFSKGIYFLKIENEDGVWVRKLVKE